MTAKYASETPVDEVLKRLKHFSACAEGIAWGGQYIGKSWGELADNISDEKFDQSWAAWYLVIAGEESSFVIRKRFIEKIRDSMMAFSLYCRLAWLTDEEDKLLEGKFKGKLPGAENELAQGIVQRKKVS